MIKLSRAALATALGLSFVASRTARAEGVGVSPLDFVSLASIDVSRFRGTDGGYDELTLGPGAIRDGSSATSWHVLGGTGDTTYLTLDWANDAGLAPLPVNSLRLDMTPATAPIVVGVGNDRYSVYVAEPSIARDERGATLSFGGKVRGRVVVLGLPGGTDVSELHVYAGIVDAALGDVTARCDGDGVHLAASGKGLLGLDVTRGLPTGGVWRATSRRTSVLDATVRFDARPSSYEYLVSAVGSGAAPVRVTATCGGAASSRPAAGPIHGVVEGFYGRAWTWHEREKVVASMGALGLDTYFYAPKSDPLQRARWREAYDATTLSRFASLAALGRGVGVDVVWAISPGDDVDASSASDVDALVAKVLAVSDAAGLVDAALLLDDLDPTKHPVDGSLGAAHAALAARLLAEIEKRDAGARLYLVPTVYAGLAATLNASQRAYLDALAALPAKVLVAWTGEGVFAKTIERADAEAFGALAGRDARATWVWDNYPVNDVVARRELFTRPVTGRETLLPALGGLVSNPMQHALASLPAIASYAELALDPTSYAAARAAARPLAARDLALALADGESPPAALGALFDELVHHPTLWPTDAATSALVAEVAAYRAAPTKGVARAAAAKSLAEHLARLALVDVDLARSLDDPALADELDAYARTTSTLARGALLAMTADRDDLGGDSTNATAMRLDGACAFSSASSATWRTLGDALQPLVPSPSGTCSTDDPYVVAAQFLAEIGKAGYLPLADDGLDASAAWSVVGPDGAKIDADGTLSWTPSRLGHFRLVALHTGDLGVQALPIDLLVVEAAVPYEDPNTGCGCRTGRASSEGRSALALGGLVLAFAAARRRRRATTLAAQRPCAARSLPL